MDKAIYHSGTLTSLEFLFNLSETLDDVSFGHFLEFLTEEWGIVWDYCNAPGDSLAVQLDVGTSAGGGFSSTTESQNTRYLVVKSGAAVIRKNIEIPTQDDSTCETVFTGVLIRVPEDQTILTEVLPGEASKWTLYLDYNEDETCPYGGALCAESDSLRKKASFKFTLEANETYSDDPLGRIALAHVTFKDGTDVDSEGYAYINTISDIRTLTPKYKMRSSFMCDDSQDGTEYDYLNNAHIFHFNTSISACVIAGHKNKLLDDYANSNSSYGVDIPALSENAFMSDRGASPLNGMAMLEPIGPFQGSAAFFDKDLRNAIKNTSFTWVFAYNFIEEVFSDETQVCSTGQPIFLGHSKVTYHGWYTALPGWYKRQYSDATYPTTFTLRNYDTWWITFTGDSAVDTTNYDSSALDKISTFNIVRDSYIHPYGSKWVEIGAYQGIVSGPTLIAGAPMGYLMDLNIYSASPLKLDFHLLPVPWKFSGESISKLYYDGLYYMNDGTASLHEHEIASLLTGSDYKINEYTIPLQNFFSDSVFDRDCDPGASYRYSRLAKHATVWAYIKGEEGQNIRIRFYRVVRPSDETNPTDTYQYQVIAEKTVQLEHSGPQRIYATFPTTGTGGDELALNPNDGNLDDDVRYGVELINLHGSYKLYVMSIQVVPGIGDAPYLPHFGFIPEWYAEQDSIKSAIRGWNPDVSRAAAEPILSPPWTEGSWWNAPSYFDVISETNDSSADVKPNFISQRFDSNFLWYEVTKGLGFSDARKFTFSAWIRFRPVIEFYPKPGFSASDYTAQEYPTPNDRFLLFMMAETNKYVEEGYCDESETITVTEYISAYRYKGSDGNYYLALTFDNGFDSETISIQLPDYDYDPDWYSDFHLVTASWDLINNKAALMIDTQYSSANLTKEYNYDYKYISIGGWDNRVDLPIVDYLHSGQFWMDELLLVDEYIQNAEHSLFYTDTRNPFTKSAQKITLSSGPIGQSSKQIVSTAPAYSLAAKSGIKNYFWNAADETATISIAAYNIDNIIPFSDADSLPLLGISNQIMNNSDTLFDIFYQSLGYGASVAIGGSEPIMWIPFRNGISRGFTNLGFYELDKHLISPNTVAVEYDVFLNVNTSNSIFTGRHDDSTDNDGYYPDQSVLALTWKAYNDPGEYYVTRRPGDYSNDTTVHTNKWQNIIDLYNKYAPHNMTMVTFGTLMPYKLSSDRFYEDSESQAEFEAGRLRTRLPHQYGEAVFGAVIMQTIHRYGLQPETYFADETYSYLCALAEPSRTNVQNNLRDGLLIPFKIPMSITSWWASDGRPLHTNTFYNADSTGIATSSGVNCATSGGAPLTESVIAPQYGDYTADATYRVWFGPQFAAGMVEQITNNNLIVNVWDLTPAWQFRIYVPDPPSGEFKHEIGHPIIHLYGDSLSIPNSQDSPLVIQNKGFDFDVVKSVSVQLIGVNEGFTYYRWWSPKIGSGAYYGGDTTGEIE